MIFLLPRRRPIIPGHKQNSLKNLSHVKDLLDGLYLKINRPEFIPLDPVQFPHRYKNKKDIEIAAFLAATIAWGRRDLILKSAEKMFAFMGKSPYDFVMKDDFRQFAGSDGGCRRSIHRTFFEHDLLYFCRGFRVCYNRYGSLEALFASGANIWEGIGLFRETMAEGSCIEPKSTNQPRYSKHISDPGAGSACKRLNLALRWLIRKEGPVDLGIWKKISPASLFIPLDLHVGRAARELELLNSNRKANDMKAVISLTEKLRAFCPEDPVKYDLALFGYSNVDA